MSDIQRPDALGRFRGAAALVLEEHWRHDRFFRVGVGRGLVGGHYQRWVDATVMRLAHALREAFDPKARSER